ncbi:hypothetical protein ACQP1G_08800 [Nocardia sp. CA-107356]|uniref:hypothetical protein n=1 Tax=Nocardia sp. CA-107356 TaxID=3239972 RepID=UPI003D8ADA21
MTGALAAGISPKVVSERVGHADVAFTLETYSHILPGWIGMQRSAARTIYWTMPTRIWRTIQNPELR